MRNLFSDIPSDLTEEFSETLLRSDHLRIERIVSRGHSSPVDFWYDQDEHEWLIVLTGHGVLRFQDTDELVEIYPGNHINISAHRKHRVEATDPDHETVWLAVFYSVDETCKEKNRNKFPN